MRYSRIGLWAVAAAVAVAVTTTVVVTATGAAGRDVLSEDGVADALAAAVQPRAPAPRRPGERDRVVGQTYRAGRREAAADDRRRRRRQLRARTSSTIHSVAPKPGYRMLMVDDRPDGQGPAAGAR